MDKYVGTGEPNCNGTKLANLLIPIPPLQEQERINNRVEGILPQLSFLLENNQSLN